MDRGVRLCRPTLFDLRDDTRTGVRGDAGLRAGCGDRRELRLHRPPWELGGA